jgi:DNA-directed RNA polymerase II subunit RPB2
MDVNIEKDTWDVIYSYFRDTPDYLVKHHLDSFNDFITAKIPIIFKSFGKSTFVRSDITDNYVYETNVYFGGRDFAGFYISKPVLFDHASSKIKQLYPNEARLKNLTYGADVFYDVDIEFSMRETKTNKYIYQNVKIPTTNFLKKMFLGTIPVMLKSCLCVLQNALPELLYQMGEASNDVGGYFIIDGHEKVIMSQERKSENRVFLESTDSNSKYSHIAEIKSVPLESFQLARTTRIQMERTGMITIRLGQDKPFLIQKEGRDVPLFTMFRFLGVESDKDIIKYICYDMDSELASVMMSHLLPSINDPFVVNEQIFDQQSAINYLDSRTRSAQMEGEFSEILKNEESRVSFLMKTIYETFLPHLGNDLKKKA